MVLAMPGETNIALSILVISHNQKDYISRCLDSILRQRINEPFEIIVSDDNSSDGTWQIIKEYEQQYPVIKAVQCNSDECKPVTRSERCGWNKANVYNHASGEFFVNIDADDYLKSDDIYQTQLDALRRNPDCSMCQQRVWQVKDGQPLSSGYAWPQHPILKDGIVLDYSDIIQNDLIGVNPTYMIRRNAKENPTEKYGKWYDDTVITYYHLQLGKVVFVDRADYVWVQYGTSISNSDKGWDRELLYALLPFHHAHYFPQLKSLLLAQPNLNLVHVTKESVFHKIRLQDITIQYIKQFDGFVPNYFANGQKGIWSKLRLARILFLYKQLRKSSHKDEKALDKLYRLVMQ